MSLVKVNLYKGCELYLTKEEFLKGLKRGKAIRRAEKLKIRLKDADERRN